MNGLVKSLIAAGSIALFPLQVSGIPTLHITDGVASLTVTDLDGDGVLTGSFSDAANGWTVIVSTGLTKPASGSASNPLMDISVIGSSFNATKDLLVTFTDQFFGPSPADFTATITGQISKQTTISYDTLYSLADSIPAGTILTSSGDLTGTLVLTKYKYSDAQVGGIATPDTSYSLSQTIKIKAGVGAKTYSLDAMLSGVPVPDGGVTVAMLGFGLLGLIAFRSRK